MLADDLGTVTTNAYRMNTPVVTYRGGPSCHELEFLAAAPDSETLVLVPMPLWKQLGELLVVHFSAVENVAVVPDWRSGERRRSHERQQMAAPERRRNLHLASPRRRDRRSGAAAVSAPPMPWFAAPYLEELSFLDREALGKRAAVLLNPAAIATLLQANSGRLAA